MGKLALIERAIAAVARRNVVTSFVNPNTLTQMANAIALAAGSPTREDVIYTRLMMNRCGT